MDGSTPSEHPGKAALEAVSPVRGSGDTRFVGGARGSRDIGFSGDARFVGGARGSRDVGFFGDARFVGGARFCGDARGSVVGFSSDSRFYGLEKTGGCFPIRYRQELLQLGKLAGPVVRSPVLGPLRVR